MLHNDPFMLLSVINTKLRDDYSNLDDLCASLDVDKAGLMERLQKAGFSYDPNTNQFR